MKDSAIREPISFYLLDDQAYQISSAQAAQFS